MKKNRLKYIFVILIQWVISTSCFAQIEIIGFVYDKANNLPIAGANIYEENTTNCVISDYSGKFKITVNDSAAVLISYIGFLDTTIIAAEYQGDKILLEEDKNVIIDYFYANSYFVGYFGDLNKFPYGISIYHMRPYLFYHLVKLSGQFNYKTDFKSNYDLKFTLKKTDLINLNRYKLSALASFQKREYMDLNINDYDIVLNNYIINRFSISSGYALKEDFSENYNLNHGVLIGISKYFTKTLTFISSDITFYTDFAEYGFTVLQRLSNTKKYLSNFRFGIEYQKYKEYNEFNIVARYSFSR